MLERHDHPLQIELAIRLASVDVATKRVEELTARQLDAHNRAHELGNQVASARADVRQTAGAVAAGEGSAKDAQTARKALRELESEAEIAELELEGIVERVTAAEEELGLRTRERASIELQLCEMIDGQLEARLHEVALVLMTLERARHRNAKRASYAAVEAGRGRINSEPIRYADERAGLWHRNDALGAALHDHELTERFTPYPTLEPSTLDDLLEAELPRMAEAAE